MTVSALFARRATVPATVSGLRSKLLLAALCLSAGLTSASGAHACTLPSDAVTVQSSRVALGGRMFTAATQTLADIDSSRSRLLVLDARCRPAWSAVVDGILSHFDVRVLSGTRLLQFVTMQVAGDGTGYVHRLLSIRAGNLMQALPPISHTGKDGFYLGLLHHGRDEGIVTWTADPRAEAEAAPHPFIVRTWMWSDGGFRGPAQTETGRKYAAPNDGSQRPDFVARAIGLPFRDQTGDITSRFRDFDGVAQRMQDLAIQHVENR